MMKKTEATKKSEATQKPFPFSLHEPLWLDSYFYRNQYLRGLRCIIILLIVNVLMVGYTWVLLNHQYTSAVYATTLEGKLFPIKEVRPQ